jgi:hypothetical protein
VDGLAMLLAPLAAKLEEIGSHASAQLVRAESASARLEALLASARRAGADMDGDPRQVRGSANGEKVIRQRDEQRKHIFAGVLESVANLRRAARQVGTGCLPEVSRIE